MGAFKFTYHSLISRPIGVRVAWLLGAGICTIPFLLFCIYYLHVLPEREWFYQLRSIRGSELTCIPMGIAAGSLASLVSRKILPMLLILFTCAAVVPFIKPLLVRLPTDAIHDQWSGDACLQSTPSTCGPASIATILRFHGLDASEREIAKHAYTYAWTACGSAPSCARGRPAGRLWAFHSSARKKRGPAHHRRSASRHGVHLDCRA